MIYTTPSCGWAIRNYAALLEKAQPFDLVSARGADGEKTEEFLAAAPLAMTPTLVLDGISVWDSGLINIFIDERFRNAPLLPNDWKHRADARRWMHFCDQKMIPLISAAFVSEIEIETASAELARAFARIEKDRLPPESQGPYFFGEQFTLVDLSYHSLFELLGNMQRVTGSAPALPVWATEWATAINERESIIRASALPAAFAEHGIEAPMHVTPAVA